MANYFKQIVSGLIAGFVAGVVGYAVDMALGATFDAFGTIFPSIAFFGVLYVVISFLIGISDAAATGIFFSIGYSFQVLWCMM